MSQKLYLNILRYGIYGSLVCMFFVFTNLLFPFITSKQIPFNILVEVMFVIWLAFVVKYPEYRPKMNWINVGILAFAGAIILSTIFSIDRNLSFWGDIERMLGVFHVLHFFVWYFIAITVMRSWRDWKIFMISSMVLAVFMCLNGLGEGKQGFSTLGNSSYVSGYLIFNMYFAFILFFKEGRNQLKWLYFVPLPIYWALFRKVDTSGALVGLGFSILVLAFLYSILHKNKKVKIASWSLMVIVIALVAGVYMNRNSEFVSSTPLLRSIRAVNVQKNTFQTRLISWQAGIKDMKNHPLLGIGWGNYSVIFDKYFKSTFYDFTRGETYFDRAHNNVIDIASTSGLVGIGAYLMIFFAAAWYLLKGYRQKYISQHDFILVSCLVIAYFVQNLAVFDSFATYLMIMMVLGYIYWLEQEGQETLLDEAGERVKHAVDALARDRRLENREIYVFVLAGIVMATIIYQYNYKPWEMLKLTIDGQRAHSRGRIEETFESYKKALSLNTVLDRDSRTSLLRAYSGSLEKLRRFEEGGQDDEYIQFLIEAAEKNLEYNPQDSLNLMLTAQLLNNVATYYKEDKEKFFFYSDRAVEYIDRSIAASPERIPIYFQKAQIILNRGEKDKAIEVLEEAAALNENYYDSFCHLGKTYLYFQDEEKGFENIDHCLELGGARMLTSAGFVKNLINHYVELEDWDKVLDLYEKLAKDLEKKEVQNWINLAKLYEQQGDPTNAAKAAREIPKLDPSLEEYVEEFIDGLPLEAPVE